MHRRSWKATLVYIGRGCNGLQIPHQISLHRPNPGSLGLQQKCSVANGPFPTQVASKGPNWANYKPTTGYPDLQHVEWYPQDVRYPIKWVSDGYSKGTLTLGQLLIFQE